AEDAPGYVRKLMSGNSKERQRRQCPNQTCRRIKASLINRNAIKLPDIRGMIHWEHEFSQHDQLWIEAPASLMKRIHRVPAVSPREKRKYLCSGPTRKSLMDTAPSSPMSTSANRRFGKWSTIQKARRASMS